MKNAASLSPQQKKTKELYELTFTTASLAAMGILFVVMIVAIVLIHWLSVWLGFSGSFSRYLGFVVPMGFTIGHQRALRKVRESGLSQESVTVDTVPKTATAFAREPIDWPAGKRTQTEVVTLVSLVILASMVGWGVWQVMGRYSPLAAKCAVVCVGCVVLAVALFSRSSPAVHIDETGITIAPNVPWRRSVSWKDIDRCEIQRTTGIYGTRFAPSCVLKDEKGEILVTLRQLDRQSLPLPGQPDEQVELETEIKRRMQGSPVFS